MPKVKEVTPKTCYLFANQVRYYCSPYILYSPIFTSLWRLLYEHQENKKPDLPRKMYVLAL